MSSETSALPPSELAKEAVARFVWQVSALDQSLAQVRALWARALQITGPQWMILTAIFEMDQGEGVSVKDVAKRIFVDPSFITTQTKLLEKRSLVRRRTSKIDARIVEMSLTDRAAKQMENLSDRRRAIDQTMFAEMTSGDLDMLTERIALLTRRADKALRQTSVDSDNGPDR